MKRTTENSDCTSYSKRYIANNTVLNVCCLWSDESILRNINKCTVAKLKDKLQKGRCQFQFKTLNHLFRYVMEEVIMATGSY